MASLRECPVCQSAYDGGEEYCTRDGAVLYDLAPPPDSTPSDPYRGRVIAGRFVLRQRIGRGGMGVVYLAVHRVLERRYAIKFLRREFIHDKRALLRFLREAKAASVVDHPNIVSIYDYGQTGEGEPYLVMEHVEGLSLYQALHQGAGTAQPGPKAGLPLPQALDVAIQVARALRHAHERGVVHRDIKPENILLTHRDGLPDWVKVLDFGLAKMVEQGRGQGQGQGIFSHASLSQDGALAGTPEFMAPELLSQGAEVGAPADLYSLGIMLHDIIAGSPPFTGELREVLRSQMQTVPPRLAHRCLDLLIPGDLDRLVIRLLDKDPARRPSAAETVTALEQIRTQLPPRSMRSLLIAQTMILPPGDPGRLFLQQRTMLLLRDPSWPGKATALALPDGSGRGYLPGPPLSSQKPTVLLPQKTTVLLPQVLQEIDNAEAQLEKASAALLARINDYGGGLWPAGWPADVQAHKAKLGEIEGAEGRLGMMQALLKDQIEESRQKVQRKRGELRRQIIDLSERLQLETLLADSEEGSIRAALLERERAFDEAEKGQDGALQQTLEKVLEQLQELRADWRRALGELAAELLRTPCPPALRGQRKAVEVLLSQFDTAVALLALLPLPTQEDAVPAGSAAGPAAGSATAEKAADKTADKTDSTKAVRGAAEGGTASVGSGGTPSGAPSSPSSGTPSGTSPGKAPGQTPGKSDDMPPKS